MNKKLKGILDKLHAAEILSLIPEVSDDTPPAGPNLVWIPVTAMDLLTPEQRNGLTPQCRAAIEEIQLPHIEVKTIEGAEFNLTGPFVEIYLNTGDLDDAFSNGKIQSLFANKLCQMIDVVDLGTPNIVGEEVDEDWIDGWMRGVLGEDNIDDDPGNPVWDDSFSDFFYRIMKHQSHEKFSPCLEIFRIIIDRLRHLIRMKAMLEGRNIDDLMPPQLVKKDFPHPFRYAGSEAFKKLIEKLYACILKKMRNRPKPVTTANDAK